MKLASGALALLILPASLSAQDDDLHRKSLREFQDKFYASSADDDQKAEAIVNLAQLKTEPVAKALAPVLLKGSLAVRVVAAKELARFQGVKGAATALLEALRARSNQGEKTRSIRLLSVIGLGELKSKEAAPDVEKLMEDKNHWIAKAAVESAGKIRVRTSVAPLIEALRRIEGPDGALDIGINPLENELPAVSLKGLIQQEIKAKPATGREFLREPILSSLKSVTGRDYAAAKDWESWWRKNKNTFQVAE